MYSAVLKNKINGEKFLGNQTLFNGKSINTSWKIHFNIHLIIIILISKISKIDFQVI